MANWAIVVGINTYWKPEYELKGAVRDALSMMQWLLTDRGGQVKPQNLLFLASPLPKGIPPQVESHAATADNFNTAVIRLLNRSGGRGERIYFYFSGHGIMKKNSLLGAEQALLMTDFDDALTYKALSLRSIWQYFLSTRFAEQFFMVDACRDLLPWKRDDDYKIGDFPRLPGTPDASRPTPAQYRLFSTQPWLRSIEVRDWVGGERGAFTEILLAGLRGQGWAKSYNQIDDNYIVRIEQLFRYIKFEIESRKLNIALDPTKPPVYQSPTFDQESGGGDPVLVRLRRDEVSQETLEIFVSPDSAWPVAEVRVISQDGEINEFRPVTGAPLTLPPLNPMNYTVRAKARGHLAERSKWPIDLYEPRRLEIGFVPIPFPPSGGGGGGGGGPDGSGSFMSGEHRQQSYDERSNGAEPEVATSDRRRHFEELSNRRSAGQAWLRVIANDPLAGLEIVDNTEKLMEAGEGDINAALPGPGFYRARLVTPEGEQVEELVHLDLGEREIIELSAPPVVLSGIGEEVMRRVDVRPARTSAFNLSDQLPDLASLRLSTLVTFSGLVELTAPKTWGNRLRRLSLPDQRQAFRNTASVRLLVVDEFLPSRAAQETLATARVRLWAEGAVPPERGINLEQSPDLPGIADLVLDQLPGPAWLALDTPNDSTAVFHVRPFADRITVLLLHRDETGRSQVFHYSFGQDLREHPLSVRRAELLQRYWLSGRLNHAARQAEALLLGPADPISLALAGFMLLRLGRHAEIEKALDKPERFGGLPDAAVLRAELALARKVEPAAEAAFRYALTSGIPITADGLDRLLAGAANLGIVDAPGVSLLRALKAHRFNGAIWTALNIREITRDIPLEKQLKLQEMEMLLYALTGKNRDAATGRRKDYMQYREMVGTREPMTVAEALRQLAKMKTERNLSFRQKNLYNRALKFVSSETASLQETSVSAAEVLVKQTLMAGLRNDEDEAEGRQAG